MTHCCTVNAMQPEKYAWMRIVLSLRVSLIARIVDGNSDFSSLAKAVGSPASSNPDDSEYFDGRTGYLRVIRYLYAMTVKW